jgi:hypothetical protein
MNGWRSSLSLSHTQKKVTEWWLEMHAYASLRTDVISIIVNGYYLSINSVGQDNVLTPWSESQWGHQVQIHCQPNLYRTNAREEVHYNTHEHTHTEELVKEQLNSHPMQVRGTHTNRIRQCTCHGWIGRVNFDRRVERGKTGST